MSNKRRIHDVTHSKILSRSLASFPMWTQAWELRQAIKAQTRSEELRSTCFKTFHIISPHPKCVDSGRVSTEEGRFLIPFLQFDSISNWSHFPDLFLRPILIVCVVRYFPTNEKRKKEKKRKKALNYGLFFGLSGVSRQHESESGRHDADSLRSLHFGPLVLYLLWTSQAVRDMIHLTWPTSCHKRQ